MANVTAALIPILTVILLLLVILLSLFNVPLGPVTILSIFLLVLLLPVLIYRDAAERNVEHAAPIAVLVFVALLLGIVPGVLAVVLYWYLRDSLANEPADRSVASSQA